MYRCRECKAEYKHKVAYCDCGNNTFDYIEEKSTKQASAPKARQPLTIEQKSEIISRIFFAFCLILSIIIWMIPIGKTPANDKADTAKQTKKQPVVTKKIPDINKIWDDTPLYQPKTAETKPQPQPAVSNPIEYFRQMETSTPQQKKN